MATIFEIIVKKIEEHFENNSTFYVDEIRWYIGITNDVERRKKEHQKKYPQMKFFRSFNARTMNISSQIEKHITQKGTANKAWKGGANENSKWVYVFKSKPTILD